MDISNSSLLSSTYSLNSNHGLQKDQNLLGNPITGNGEILIQPEPSECSIKVICRFRPLNPSEERAGSSIIVKFPQTDETSCVVGGKCYMFDKVYRWNATQERIYNESAKPIVKDVLAGYNGTIFAYGQTSSGKTHTMEGIIGDGDLEGIIPRLISDIFQHIYYLDENLEFHIKVSYYEIYMDKIRDLLDVTNVNLAVHEDKNRIPYVKGVTERFVVTPNEVMEVIAEGKANRHVAVTNMNEHSSRSHSVFLINVKQENAETQKKLSGKLYLVDLAGSEKVSKTGAEGSVLDEAKNINKSLSALGNVIAALAEGTKSHVPYRDSKLTRILQESLGGNARTTIIICCSPASFNETETKSTLMFGQRAKTIKNTITVNEELTAEEWKRRYEREKEKVQKFKEKLARVLAELLRWRKGETVSSEEQTDFSVPAKNTAPGNANTTLQIDDLLDESINGPSLTANANISNLLVNGTAALNLGKMSDEERKRFEQEKDKLYMMLDEKDDELTSQSQTIEDLRAQIVEMNETLLNLRIEQETRSAEISRLQTEADAAREEVKEVLAALEELAQNYDRKTTEAQERAKENETMTLELGNKINELCNMQNQLHEINDSLDYYKKRVSEFVSIDLLDVASVLNKVDEFKANLEMITGKTDEEFAVARLYINKLKVELENLLQKSSDLENKNTESQHKVKENEKELLESRMLIAQQEAKLKSLNEALQDLETKKRTLEQQFDYVNEEYSQLKNQESKSHLSPLNQQSPLVVPINSSVANAPTDDQSKEDLIDVDAHIKQLTALRDEIAEKQKIITELKDDHVTFQTQIQSLAMEQEKLKNELDLKTYKLEEFTRAAERKEQARRDFKGLEDTVNKELQTLHTLRKLFVSDLTSRIQRKAVIVGNNSQPQNTQNSFNSGVTNPLSSCTSLLSNVSTSTLNQGINNTNSNTVTNGIENEDEDSSLFASNASNANIAGSSSLLSTLTTSDKQKIQFLENNLDQLTRVHKQLVRDNADLRCEVPKLEKRLRLTAERVKTLEVALRAAKEAAAGDRRRYQNEVERIKEAVRAKNAARMKAGGGHYATIVKPIRAGHQPK